MWAKETSMIKIAILDTSRYAGESLRSFVTADSWVQGW